MFRFVFPPYVMMTALRSPLKAHLAPTGLSPQPQRKGSEVTVKLVRVESYQLAGELPAGRRADSKWRGQPCERKKIPIKGKFDCISGGLGMKNSVNTTRLVT